MKPIRRILVALDGSEPSANALEWAIRLARAHGAAIDLVHCYEVSALLGLYGEDARGSFESGLRRAADEWLSGLAHRVASEGIRVELHLVRGNPAEAINERASAIGADLIAMGTRGRSGLAHVLLGSVAERTMQRAPCPVLAVPPEKGA